MRASPPPPGPGEIPLDNPDEDFIDETKTRAIFAVAAATPDGFTLRREYLKPEVTHFALPFDD